MVSKEAWDTYMEHLEGWMDDVSVFQVCAYMYVFWVTTAVGSAILAMN